jgi:hypothetical protein
MPGADRHRPAEQERQPPADRLVLAAVARAVRHRLDGASGVALWLILDHLAIAPRASAARHVRLRLAALERDGSLSAGRRHSVSVWAPTDRGLRRLRRDARALDELPESPQHRAWRQARVTAGQELDRFAADLDALLAQAGSLLAGGAPSAGSDAWLVLAEELRHACRRVGSAVHCLHEWPEPGELLADLDLRNELPHSHGLDVRALERLPSLRASRRNVGLWQDGPFARDRG